MYFIAIFAALLLSSSSFVATNAQNGPGVTFDECKQDSGCRAPRTCKVDDGGKNVNCRTSDPICFCIPKEFVICDYLDADKDPKSCPYGERCTKLTSDTGSTILCMSCPQAEHYNGINGFEIPDGDAITCNTTGGVLSSNETSEGGSTMGVGRNMDSCSIEDDCMSPRNCVLLNGNQASACTGRSGCVCYDLTNVFTCTAQLECPDPLERCARIATSDDAYKGECTSTNLIGNNGGYLDIREVDRDTQNADDVLASGTSTNPGTGNNPEVCVDATLLSHLHPSKLVFSTHRRASVLCDAFQSCATTGHIVQYNNKIMTMGSYCENYATCKRRTLWVNSPKFEKGLRVKSRTDSLAFTTLAARYNTIWEERAMRLLVATGF